MDEENCTASTAEPPSKIDNVMPTCHDWMFHCKNDRCVPNWWKCDGVNDCGDSSDELGCSGTPTLIPDIPPTEETPFVCLRSQFMCDSGRCISKAYVCDDTKDCPNGEDELNCPPEKCGRDKFR